MTNLRKARIKQGEAGRKVFAEILHIGPEGQSRNRLRTAVAETYAEATNTVSWNAADDISEIRVLITAKDGRTTDTAPNTENYALLAFNATNESIANGWLTEVDSEDTDAQVEKILIGERVTFSFSDPLTRLDVLPVDISASLSNIHMFVGAR